MSKGFVFLVYVEWKDKDGKVYNCKTEPVCAINEERAKDAAYHTIFIPDKRHEDDKWEIIVLEKRLAKEDPYIYKTCKNCGKVYVCKICSQRKVNCL